MKEIRIFNYTVKNITLDIESGKTIAFVGTSGSGKTTVVKTIVNPLQGRGGLGAGEIGQVVEFVRPGHRAGQDDDDAGA